MMRSQDQDKKKEVTIASIILMLIAIVIGSFFLPKLVISNQRSNQIEFREQPSLNNRIQRIDVDSRGTLVEEGRASRDR